jgi:membrane protein YqaA with SNARE-associated domain
VGYAKEFLGTTASQNKPMNDEKQPLAPGSLPFGSVKDLNNRGLNKRRRTILFVLEFLFIGTLLVIWASSTIIQKSTNLLVLFFYSFPSEFLIGILPHEPVLLYFGKFFHPLTVTLISLPSTIMVEISNYFVIRYIFDLRSFQKFQNSSSVNKVVKLFKKAPFLALWIAGFAPVPFYPFRFLVVLVRYPVWNYALALVLSRGPRFFLLALAGKLMKIPNSVIILLFVFLILSANIPLLRNYWRKRHLKKAES